MGLMIPGELADLLNELGYIWPESDETELFGLGQDWLDFQSNLTQLIEDAVAVTNRVVADNHGPAIEAFLAEWKSDESALAVLDRARAGGQAIGAGLVLCAAVVLALKINVIVQLTLLLIAIVQAIATAAPTFGASLLEVPVFKRLTDLAINFLISKALEVILG